MNLHNKYIFLFLSCMSLFSGIAAQDTTALPANIGSQPITITSEFTPVLKESAKINITSSENLPELPKPQFRYNVPAQPVITDYNSATLFPLAVSIDTSALWRNSNFVKLGYGNLSTPYAEAGFSFGSGVQQAISLYGKHTQSKGSIDFQEFGKTYAEANGAFNLQQKHLLAAKLFFDRNSQYEYGFQNQDRPPYTAESLLRRYATFGGNVKLESIAANNANIRYKPQVSFYALNDNRSVSESGIKVDIPISKELIDYLYFNLGVTADISNVKSGNQNGSINNGIFYVAPSLSYEKENLKAEAGATPSWDRGAFYLLPNISLEALLGNRFTFIAGWKGHYNKTTYRSLTSFNPWIELPQDLLNNRVNEFYGGFKGSSGNHLTYKAKAAFQKLHNLPLFINDNIDERTFSVINETSLSNLQIRGEVGYDNKETFSLTAGLTKNFFNSLKDNEKPYGHLPLELDASLRWRIIKNLFFTSDAFFWNGAHYLHPANNSTEKLSSAFDLNAGIEVNLIRNIGVWFQVNNLLNNKYQRWNHYPVLGTNFLGGVVFNFGKK